MLSRSVCGLAVITPQRRPSAGQRIIIYFHLSVLFSIHSYLHSKPIHLLMLYPFVHLCELYLDAQSVSAQSSLLSLFPVL